MSKKSGNHPKLLSPENYIRQKSRSLPIKECYLNKHWQEENMCTIFIVRQHANDNVTFCMYLVDLACLGVKDTIFKFNVPYEELEELLQAMRMRGLGLKKTTYNLVHNIIHAGVEYAESFGFKPCKDFTSITRHFLEEDTDEIPLIAVECGGVDGKPLYVNTGFDSPLRERQILDQLKKTAGEGNYNYILHVDNPANFEDDNIDDDDEDFDDEDFDDDDEMEHDAIIEELEALDIEEKKILFFELLSKEHLEDEELDEENTKRLSLLSDMLALELVGNEAIEKSLELFEQKFDRDFVGIEKLPENIFEGMLNVNEAIAAELVQTIASIILNDNPEKAIAAFREKAGEAPISDFIELYYLQMIFHKDYWKKLKKSYEKYPEYFLIKTYYLSEIFQKKKKPDLKTFEDIWINNHKPLTSFEAECYFASYTTVLVQDNSTDLATLMAYEEYLEILDIFISHSIITNSLLINLIKINKLLEIISPS